MNSIYDYTVSLIAKSLSPLRYRKVGWQALFSSMLSPMQWLRDLFFEDYAAGFTGNKWSAGAYLKGDRVRYKNHSVYEAQADTSGEPSVSDDWMKIQEIWIGATERSKYNGGKLLLEYALNKWFDTQFRQPTANVADPLFYTPKSDIYIKNIIPANQVFIFSNSITTASKFSNSGFANFFQNLIDFDATCFTINIPTAVYDALLPGEPTGTTANKDKIVRSFADKYVAAGIIYTITIY